MDIDGKTGQPSLNGLFDSDFQQSMKTGVLRIGGWQHICGLKQSRVESMMRNTKWSPFIKTKHLRKADLQPLLHQMKQCTDVEVVDIAARLEKLASVYWDSPREWPVFSRDPQPSQHEIAKMTGPFGASMGAIELELEDLMDNCGLTVKPVVESVFEMIRDAKAETVGFTVCLYYCRCLS